MTKPESEPIWLDAHAVLLIHQQQLAEHGGLTGIRNRDMLESSLAAPRQQYYYGEGDLYGVEDAEARAYYIREAADQGWSSRELEALHVLDVSF